MDPQLYQMMNLMGGGNGVMPGRRAMGFGLFCVALLRSVQGDFADISNCRIRTSTRRHAFYAQYELSSDGTPRDARLSLWCREISVPAWYGGKSLRRHGRRSAGDGWW